MIIGKFSKIDKHAGCHPSVEKDLSLKIEVRDQTIWTSTPEL